MYGRTAVRAALGLSAPIDCEPGFGRRSPVSGGGAVGDGAADEERVLVTQAWHRAHGAHRPSHCCCLFVQRCRPSARRHVVCWSPAVVLLVCCSLMRCRFPSRAVCYRTSSIARRSLLQTPSSVASSSRTPCGDRAMPCQLAPRVTPVVLFITAASRVPREAVVVSTSSSSRGVPSCFIPLLYPL